MMTREELKAYAAGTYILNNPTFEQDKMKSYVDGAIMMHDLLEKKKRDTAATRPEPLKPSSTIYTDN